MALVRCAQNYNPDHNAKFSTYAARRVAGAMQDAIRTHTPWSGGSTAIRKSRELPQLFSLSGRAPSEDRESDLADYIVGGDVADEAMQELEKTALWRELRLTLNDREFTIVRRVLNGDSLAVISTDLGISESRTSQVYRTALRKCRENVMEAVGA